MASGSQLHLASGQVCGQVIAGIGSWRQVQVDYLILLYWWDRWDDMAQRIVRVQPAIAQHGTPLQRAALFGNLSRYHNRRARFAPSDIALAYARDALTALAAWRLHTAPYPFWWQALWPLIGVALAQNCPVEAIPHARQLCDPSQQALPPAIEQLLLAALAAWDTGQPVEAGNLLRAHTLARQANLV